MNTRAPFYGIRVAQSVLGITAGAIFLWLSTVFYSLSFGSPSMYTGYSTAAQQAEAATYLQFGECLTVLSIVLGCAFAAYGIISYLGRNEV